VTVEESSIRGGFGSAVLELLAEHDVRVPVRTLAVPDRIFEQASQARLREMAGLSYKDIAAAARSAIETARRDQSLSLTRLEREGGLEHAAPSPTRSSS